MVNDLIMEVMLNITDGIFKLFDGYVKMALSSTLFTEKYLDGILLVDVFSGVYKVMYSVAVILMALKFLQRGFSVYILWRDGDADNPPTGMIMGVVCGVILMLIFPFIYQSITEVILWLFNALMGVLKLSPESVGVIQIANMAKQSLILLFIFLVYGVIGIIMWLQMLKRGFELLILRVGFPIACIGLVNSDGGIFKTYISMILKTTITLMLQAILMSASFRFVGALDAQGFLVGIAALMSAYSIPTLLQNFLVGSGPSMGNSVSSTVRMMQMVRGLSK